MDNIRGRQVQGMVLATSRGGHTIPLPPLCTLPKNLAEKSLEDNTCLHFSIENLVDNTSHLLKEELGFVNSHTEDILIIMNQIGRLLFSEEKISNA